MKRDIYLVRQILLELEQQDEPYNWEVPDIDGYSRDEVSYHVMLLAKANFITAIDDSGPDTTGWIPTGITWQGHEFLNAARDNTRWAKAIAIVKQKGGTLALETLKAALIDLMRRHM